MGRLYEEQGLTSAEYAKIHKWLLDVRHKGACEHCGTQRSVQNALKEGCRYEMNVSNYISLCTGCHQSYDKKIWLKTHTAKRPFYKNHHDKRNKQSA